MRYFIALLLCLSTSSFASTHITCYSGGHVVYNGYTNDIYYIDDKSFAFKDRRTDRDIFVWASECVVKS